MKNRIGRNLRLFYFFVASIFTLLIHLLVPLVGHAEESSKPIVLGPYYDIFRDPSNDITIDDILTGEYDNSFVASTQKKDTIGSGEARNS